MKSTSRYQVRSSSCPIGIFIFFHSCVSLYPFCVKFSGHVAEGMTQGAEAIGRGLVRASTKGAELMKIGTIKLKENVAPTLEDREVDPKLKASLEAASWTADKAVKVSGYLGREIKSLLSASCKFQPTLSAKLNLKVWLFIHP